MYKNLVILAFMWYLLNIDSCCIHWMCRIHWNFGWSKMLMAFVFMVLNILWNQRIGLKLLLLPWFVLQIVLMSISHTCALYSMTDVAQKIGWLNNNISIKCYLAVLFPVNNNVRSFCVNIVQILTYVCFLLLISCLVYMHYNVDLLFWVFASCLRTNGQLPIYAALYA